MDGKILSRFKTCLNYKITFFVSISSFVVVIPQTTIAGVYYSSDPAVAREERAQYEYFKTQCPDDRENDLYGERYYRCVEDLFDRWQSSRKSKNVARPAPKKERSVRKKEGYIGKSQDAGNLTDPANVEPDPDWAGDTRKRILDGKGEKEVAVNHNPNRLAPYGASSCAEIKPAPNRGTIDWDWVTVRNKCSYPLKVLTCYYDKGEDARCATHNKNAIWGLSGTINPGGVVTSVATSKQWPWFVKVIVCDMRDGNNLLCVPPERLTK
ncbi:hypothetical protein AM571_CH02442 [Rhizobium etli 8C-3]|uniref:Uncharacterized protein n=1 Tax=Rhizobium etli 8C-3 TaxID=538025 RepID=A0A1L5P534_RHIET|nr:hypothetical protein [Rhizobium etli]APO75251.1 hypothetical protein AM571_CH02442 [Rhizobium etli 8C-3]